MIVDDEPAIRRGLQRLIKWKDYGFSICSLARNGNDALKKMNKIYPHLIITDIKMPRLDGLGLIEYIRETINDQNMAFIVLSGYNDFNFAKQAIKYNVKRYLLKPIDEEELIELLQEVRQEVEKNNNEKYFYEKRTDKFNRHFKDIKGFNELIQDLEQNKKGEIENTLKKIFQQFWENKLHPAIIKIHLDNYFIKISDIVKNLNGDIDNLFNQNLFQINLTNLSYSELKEEVTKFSYECSDYIVELKKNCGTINRAKQYIKNNYNRKIKVKEVAEELYVNPAYLGQLFKKETGVNFRYYLNQIRLKKAREMLQRTDLCIYQIAQKVGYSNTDYFIKKFKESEGCTPVEYRKKTSNKQTEINKYKKRHKK